VANNLENITLQKLFAKTCINLGHLEEALQTFKYLLLLNPQDANVADQIKLLEDDLLVNNEIEEENFEQPYAEFNEDDWVQVDFNKNEPTPEEDEKDPLAEWTIKKSSPLEDFKEEIKKDKIEVKQHGLDDSYYYQEFDQYSDDVIPAKEVIDELSQKIDETNNPIITHTLVDLYCDQGHIEKARVVLENILELHPNDMATQKKLEEIIKLEKMGNAENLLVEPAEVVTPLHVVESHDEVTDEIEDDDADKIEEIKTMFQFFQDKLNARAQVKLEKL
jgi:tetratricopeptide (TPR) repeat protein